MELSVKFEPTITVYGIDAEFKHGLNVIVGDSAVGKTYLSHILDVNMGEDVGIAFKEKDIKKLVNNHYKIIVVDNFEHYLYRPINKLQEMYDVLSAKADVVVAIKHSTWSFEQLDPGYKQFMIETDTEKRMLYVKEQY